MQTAIVLNDSFARFTVKNRECLACADIGRRALRTRSENLFLKIIKFRLWRAKQICPSKKGEIASMPNHGRTNATKNKWLWTTDVCAQAKAGTNDLEFERYSWHAFDVNTILLDEIYCTHFWSFAQSIWPNSRNTKQKYRRRWQRVWFARDQNDAKRHRRRKNMRAKIPFGWQSVNETQRAEHMAMAISWASHWAIHLCNWEWNAREIHDGKPSKSANALGNITRLTRRYVTRNTWIEWYSNRPGNEKCCCTRWCRGDGGRFKWC